MTARYFLDFYDDAEHHNIKIEFRNLLEAVNHGLHQILEILNEFHIFNEKGEAKRADNRLQIVRVDISSFFPSTNLIQKGFRLFQLGSIVEKHKS